MKPGPESSSPNCAGLRVGNAQDEHAENSAECASADALYASVHGWAVPPHARDGIARPDKSVAAVDALVLSGALPTGWMPVRAWSNALRVRGRFRLAMPIPLVRGGDPC